MAKAVRPQHIAIIDPAVRTPELDCLNAMAQWSPLPLSYHLPAMFGMRTLESFTDSSLKGIVVLGSAASVNDGDDWQVRLTNWLRPRIEAGTPTLALCYGHQLLAHMFGGHVGFMYPDHTKLKGFRRVDLTEDRLWGAATSGQVVISHAEAVMTCPVGFRVSGKSTAVAIEAITHETLPAWGFQCHPEATACFLENQEIAPPPQENALDFGRQLVKQFLSLASG